MIRRKLGPDGALPVFLFDIGGTANELIYLLVKTTGPVDADISLSNKYQFVRRSTNVKKGKRGSAPSGPSLRRIIRRRLCYAAARPIEASRSVRQVIHDVLFPISNPAGNGSAFSTWEIR